MATLDENEVIDIASRALGGTLQAHRKYKEDCNASAPLPLNPTSISCDSSPETELHLNVLSSSVHSPSRNHFENQKPQAPALKLDKTAPAERSGLHLAENSKGAQRHLPRSGNAKLAQEFPIKLQEVIVVGSDFETGLPQSVIHHQRSADARCSPADDVPVSSSRGAFLSAARDVRANNKIIGALGVERKGKSGTKALVTCIRSQITAAGVDVPAGRIDQGSSLVQFTTHETHHSNPNSAAHRSDDATNPTSVPPPPPPPRSRSSCRMRPISGFDATAGISLSPPLPDAAKEGTRTKVVPAERSSKKHSTKRHANSDGLPPMNRTQQIEEC